jgi:hypothetical protein
MAGPPDSPTNEAAAASLPEQSDEWLARILGRDLQTATLRIGLYAVVACAILAAITWLVG